MKWFLILICISLMTNDVGHFFLCLLVIFISSLSTLILCFLKNLSSYYWDVRVLHIFWIKSLIRYMTCKCFLPFCEWSLLSYWSISKWKNFDEVQSIKFSFIVCVFGIAFNKLLDISILSKTFSDDSSVKPGLRTPIIYHCIICFPNSLFCHKDNQTKVISELVRTIYLLVSLSISCLFLMECSSIKTSTSCGFLL